MTFESRFLFALGLTLLIEIPVVTVFVKALFKLKSQKIKKIIFISFLASALTLPYLWFILPNFINGKHYLLIGEILVILAEALIYYQLIPLNTKRALITSTSANLISYFLGIYFLKILF